MHERTRNLHLSFDPDAFDELTQERGFATDAEKAAFLGVSESQWNRVSRGLTKPGATFIAACVWAFPGTPDVFNKLFPITPGDKPIPAEELAPILTKQETAKVLRVGLTKLGALTKSGALTAVKVGGSVRYRRTDVEMYIDQLQAVAA